MPIQQSAKELLGQLHSVIDQLQEEDFRKPIPVLSGSSIGQHIRHTIEFFLCLMDGANQGELNYDNRKHDKFIEEDPKLAVSVIESIQGFLEKDLTNHKMDLLANYNLVNEEPVRIPSSFLRELAYNIEHAIHHMALIKIGVRALDKGIQLPDHFGVASSTVRYQQGKA